MFVSSHLFSSFRISTCLILFPFSSLPPDCSHLSLFHSFTGSDEWSSALWESRCCAIHILSEKVVCAGVSARRVCVSVCLFLWVNLIKPAYCLLTDIFHTISHRRVSVRLFCNSWTNSLSCVSLSGYSCSCSALFTGGRCETEISVCMPNPCQNGGVCKPIGNAFICSCKRGYTGVTSVYQHYSTMSF